MAIMNLYVCKIISPLESNKKTTESSYQKGRPGYSDVNDNLASENYVGKEDVGDKTTKIFTNISKLSSKHCCPLISSLVIPAQIESEILKLMKTGNVNRKEYFLILNRRFEGMRLHLS